MSQGSSSEGPETLDHIEGNGIFRSIKDSCLPKERHPAKESIIVTRRTVVFGFLLSLVPTFLSAGIGPRINFAIMEHDFGDVVHGASPSVELTCTNTGDDVLILDQIESSCGCAKALRGSDRITPGSSSKIYAQIETLGMPPGRHSKNIAIHSNDPEHPRTTLKLKFNVIRHVVIVPDFLAIRLLEPDQDAVFPVKATNHWTEPITLKSATGDGADEVVLDPREIVVPPGGKMDFRLCVRAKPGNVQPHLKGTALIETSDPAEKMLYIRYFIQLPNTKRSSDLN